MSSGQVSDAPLVIALAAGLQEAMRAYSWQSAQASMPSWTALGDKGRERLRAGVMALVTEHADTLRELLDSLHPDAEVYAAGEPA